MPAPNVKQGERRDPFLGLIQEKKAAPAGPIVYPPGKKGLVIGNLVLKGIARAVDGGWIAVVIGNNGRTFFLRDGDQLFDGVVSRIQVDRVVFSEKLSTSLGEENAREVVKRLTQE
jgi:hypothetical protein